jgi:hypothetical protein
MHHGRAAIVVRALDEHGGHDGAVRRGGAWLKREIAAAMAGKTVGGWPTDRAVIAGTLALARMSGVDVTRELAAAARDDALRGSPWHAAQVVAVLGGEAPEALWSACVEALPSRPWAPWTLLAARARQDSQIVEQTARALCASIRASAPHEGGCAATSVPEIALTALVVEALDGLPDADARDALRRARRFLASSQLLQPAIPAPLEPELAHGAFPGSPVVIDVLRCDVTAHALRASVQD